MREKLMKLIKKLSKLANRRKYETLVIACLLCAFFIKYIEDILLLSTLVILVCSAGAFLRFFPIPVGMEFVMPTIFIVSVKYGMLAGMIVGSIVLALHVVLAGDALERRIPSFLGVMAAVMVSTKLSRYGSYGIIGIAIALAFDAATMPLYYFLGAKAPRILAFMTTHLMFNYFSFKYLVPLLLSF